MKVKKKIIVAYLSTKYVDKKALKRFINNYKKNISSCKHSLLICYKNLDDKELIKRIKIAKKIKHIEFIDPELSNDHEWGTMYRIGKKYKKTNILWMNDHSYPNKKCWLKVLSNYIQPNRIIGCSASYSSHYSNSFYRKPEQSYFNYIINIIKTSFYFFSFPNPHLRSNGMLFYSNDFVKFMKNRTVRSKFDSYCLESGKNSLTNYFIKKNYDVVVVNGDGNIYFKEDWPKSDTFAFKKKNNLLISDNQTRAYNKLKKKLKIRRRKEVWGLR